jgi:quercetin dioxygenase-like cupin family protein
MRARKVTVAGLVLLAVLLAGTARFADVAAHDVAEKTLLDNEHVLVMEYVFPAGYKGEEHEAPVNEFAYVVDGQFGVVTKGKEKTVVKKGAVEWASKGVVHYSVNETRRPARVLVVYLKER